MLWIEKAKQYANNTKIPEDIRKEITVLIYCSSCSHDEAKFVNKLKELGVIDDSLSLVDKYR